MSPIIPFPAAHPGMFSPSAEPWEYIMWVVCILTRTPSLSFTHTRANTYTRCPRLTPRHLRSTPTVLCMLPCATHVRCTMSTLHHNAHCLDDHVWGQQPVTWIGASPTKRTCEDAQLDVQVTVPEAERTGATTRPMDWGFHHGLARVVPATMDLSLGVQRARGVYCREALPINAAF